MPVSETSTGEAVAEALERARSGGPEKYHQKLAEQGKLFVRERLRLLLDDDGSFAEEGLLVSALAGELPADGVVTGVGPVGGRPVAVMANDPTVKAGSWGPGTVEKIIRIIELARHRLLPLQLDLPVGLAGRVRLDGADQLDEPAERDLPARRRKGGRTRLHRARRNRGIGGGQQHGQRQDHGQERAAQRGADFPPADGHFGAFCPEMSGCSRVHREDFRVRPAARPNPEILPMHP